MRECGMPFLKDLQMLQRRISQPKKTLQALREKEMGDDVLLTEYHKTGMG
jgi:hypothetical protein